MLHSYKRECAIATVGRGAAVRGSERLVKTPQPRPVLGMAQQHSAGVVEPCMQCTDRMLRLRGCCTPDACPMQSQALSEAMRTLHACSAHNARCEPPSMVVRVRVFRGEPAARAGMCCATAARARTRCWTATPPRASCSCAVNRCACFLRPSMHCLKLPLCDNAVPAAPVRIRGALRRGLCVHEEKAAPRVLLPSLAEVRQGSRMARRQAMWPAEYPIPAWEALSNRLAVPRGSVARRARLRLSRPASWRGPRGGSRPARLWAL